MTTPSIAAHTSTAVAHGTPPLPRLRPALRLLTGAVFALALAACGGGGGGSAAQTATVAQVPATPAVVSISASPATVTLGQVVSVSWSATNTTSADCTASGAWSGTLPISGTDAVTPSVTGKATYTLTCSGVSNSTSVTVNPAPPQPTVSLALSPASITSGQSAQLTWSSANASSCSAGGAWSGSRATTGSVAVAPAAAGTYDYTLTCSGDGGSASGSATLAVSATRSNSAAMLIDNGPAGASGAFNVPYVSVTVCRPGTTVCQTIDHVLVDTGSYGLRLLAPLNAALALPAVTTTSGSAAGECGKFISGYTWGAVRQADVKIADETAAAISIQVVGDSGAAYAGVPSDCSSSGNNIGTLSALGAKGILGVGLFKQDCGDACVRTAANGSYYACGASGCTASTMPLARQVSNPVASFASDNNGVLLVLPAVSAAGSTSLSGTLVFGVGTQANNAIAGESVFRANSSTGDFSTTYKGRTYSASFIDSGSNAYYFSDTSIPSCSLSSGFYCPLGALSLSATNASFDGSGAAAVSFIVVNVDGLGQSINAAQVGGTLDNRTGTSLGNAFDWGLPFFYGRRVFVVFEGSSSGAGTGPYWAY